MESGDSVVPTREVARTTRERMAAEGIPVGTDNATLLALGAPPLTKLCPDCAGTGRDAEHRQARFVRHEDYLSCSIHGDIGWRYEHGDCSTCGGSGRAVA